MADYYVNPALASDTGTGTAGDPFGDLQYALNQVTRSATGDTFFIAEGTTETLTAALVYTTYGVPTETGQLRFVGEGSGATIDCGGLGTRCPSFTILRNLTFLDYENANISNGIIPQSRTASAYDCHFTGSSNAGRPRDGRFERCYFGPNSGLWPYGGLVEIVGCFFDGGPFYHSQGAFTIRDCIIKQNLQNTGFGGSVDITNNLFLGGVVHIAGNDQVYIANNLFVGSSAAAIVTNGFRPALVAGNAVYGHTAEISSVTDPIEYEPGIVLADNPLVDQPGGDYSLTAAGQTALAYLRTWPNLATTPGSTDAIGAWHPSGSPRRVLSSPYLIGRL